MSEKAGASELSWRFWGRKQENQARVRWTWKPGRSVEMARMLSCGCRFRWGRKQEVQEGGSSSSSISSSNSGCVKLVDGTRQDRTGWWRMENAGEAIRKGESASERFWGVTNDLLNLDQGVGI